LTHTVVAVDLTRYLLHKNMKSEDTQANTSNNLLRTS